MREFCIGVRVFICRLSGRDQYVASMSPPYSENLYTALMRSALVEDECMYRFDGAILYAALRRTFYVVSVFVSASALVRNFLYVALVPPWWESSICLFESISRPQIKSNSAATARIMYLFKVAFDLSHETTLHQ